MQEVSISTALQFDDEVTRRLVALYQTSAATKRREAVLDAMQFQPGERVLDIGTGPGFLAAQIAEAVGERGQVQGIDMSEPMLELARQRCASKPWVAFQSGSATELPVGDEEFDAAISVQVYEYVDDVEKALTEMYRVLRPGGRAAIVSTDWDAIVWQSSDPAWMNRVLDAFTEHCAHTALPRTLPSRLRAAGFLLREPRVIPQFDILFTADTYSYQIARLIGSFVPGRRGVKEEEADSWLDDLRQTNERGAYFFSLNQYLYLVAKPK
jgi:arsenite methyltransferase